MTYPTWPSDLPQKPEQEGYNRTMPDGRLYQPMAQGPAKVRRWTSAAVRPVNLVFRISAAQLARFEEFWDQDTAGGTSPFYMPDAALSTLGTPPSPWLVMFGQDAPVAVPVTYNIFSLSFTVNVLP